MPIQGVGTIPFFNVTANGVVNSTGTGDQQDAHVVLLSDGRLVFVWTTPAADGLGIRGRVFDADGTPDGDDFIVETTTNGDQSQISVAALQDGHFVVTWQSSEVPGDGSNICVRARVFDADDVSSAAPDFIVNTTTDSFQSGPAVTLLSDGRFAIAWSSGENTGPGGDFSIERARIFNADGSSADNDFVVNSTLPGIQRIQESPSITASGDGFLATWLSAGEDFAVNRIRARFFDSDGDPVGDAFVVNTTNTNLQGVTPAVAVLSNGNFVMAWESTDADPSDPFNPDSQDGSGTCLRARVFASDGIPLGDDFIVDTSTQDNQSEPSIVALADGRFVVAYSSRDTGDGSQTCVRARIFDNDGTPSGDDFILNFVPNGDQFRPSLVALADGKFVATWESWENLGGDGSGSNIRAQIFDPKIFNGTDANDTWHGGSMADTITGGGGNDILKGMEGNDTLIGGAQRDLLFGGPGQDSFDFNSVAESVKGSKRDQILDFERGIDKIDLIDIDAKKGGIDNQFKWIGKHSFHDKKGELHYVKKGGYVIVEGDTTGNGKANFQIKVDDVSKLSADDFLL